MPEHVHLLIYPNSESLTVDRILSALKRPFARKVLNRWLCLKAPILKRLRDKQDNLHFWQAGGGYDRNVFSDHEIWEKIEYTHANPVRRKLVEAGVQWKWSSARHFAGLEYDGPPIELP